MSKINLDDLWCPECGEDTLGDIVYEPDPFNFSPYVCLSCGKTVIPVDVKTDKQIDVKNDVPNTSVGDALAKADLSVFNRRMKPYSESKCSCLKESENKEAESALYSLEQIKPFIPKYQYYSLRDLVRKSEEKEFFIHKVKEIEEIIKSIPLTYKTDGIPLNEKKAYLHYFGSSYNAYIFEKDMTGDGTEQAYGWASFGEDGELGYISIEELIKEKSIELDLYFDPKPFGDIK